jgi:hypothetical protein
VQYFCAPLRDFARRRLRAPEKRSRKPAKHPGALKHFARPNLPPICHLDSSGSISNTLCPFHIHSSAPLRPAPLATPRFCMAHLHKGARMFVAQQVPQPRSPEPVRRSHRGWVDQVLTISKLKRWSINYYIDTARAAQTASCDVARAGGGLGEYYSEHETRTPTWLLARLSENASTTGCGSRRQNPRCAKSVPRRAQTARHSIDTVDTNKPLTCAFGDAIASLETSRTLWPGFTHQRSAVRYRPRPPKSCRSSAYCSTAEGDAGCPPGISVPRVS